MIKLTTPIDIEQLKTLKAGDVVLLSGTIYTGRDAAHKRLCQMIDNGTELPFDINNSVIYYVGPTPAKEGQVIGSCGPTSSYRMDAYTEPLLKKGLKVMIGKGPRSQELKDLLKKYQAVYLSAIGGTAALISQSVTQNTPVAFEDLGAEAIRKLEVKDFYAVVTYDIYGGDLLCDGIKRYEKDINKNI